MSQVFCCRAPSAPPAADHLPPVFADCPRVCPYQSAYDVHQYLPQGSSHELRAESGKVRHGKTRRTHPFIGPLLLLRRIVSSNLLEPILVPRRRARFSQRSQKTRLGVLERLNPMWPPGLHQQSVRHMQASVRLNSQSGVSIHISCSGN